jgi:flagellar motility protein MotE (MotC chaperone)
MRRWQKHLYQDPVPRKPFVVSARPILLGTVVTVAVLSSWGIEYLVQASSSPGAPAPASLTPPSVPVSSLREQAVKSSDGVPASSAPPSGISAQPAPVTDKPQQTQTPEGPALGVPKEVIGMLDQRKRDLDRREESVKNAEDRLTMLKAELEQILTKYEKLVEAADKRRKDAKDKLDKAATEKKTKQEQAVAELRNQHQAQLAKIFESMPSEEAAARLEKMPDRKAIEVLRLLKGKTAGAILATIKPERAAKLTEQLLATP